MSFAFHTPTVPSGAEAPLRWNDVEALPVHLALVAMAVLVWLGFTDGGQSMQLALAKLIGIIGCIALRRAWMTMDQGETPA